VTARLYRDDPYLLEFDAQVLAVREHEGRPAVVLDRTAFYPESGGQPWDTGRLGASAVVAVFDNGAEVVHVLDRPLPPGPVRGSVDAERRADHRQQHHGQHLLSRAFVEEAQAQTVSFHLGALESSIDLDRLIGSEQAEAAERKTNEIVWSARPVSVRVVTRAEATALGLTPPPDAGDAVRLVDAEGFDRQPCGGTHPRNTAEVGVVLVTSLERYKGGTRVHFVCGERARRAFRESTQALDAIGRALSVSRAGAAEAVQRLVDQQAQDTRKMAELQDRALEGEARRLLADSAGPVIVASYAGWPPADLRTLALHLVHLSRCVALVGSRDEKAHLVFAQTEGLPHDIPGLLKEALALVGGRGGGRGNVAQGGGDRTEGLDQALAEAARRVAPETPQNA
jgi:alanyl-tRNA synthetase